MSKTLKQWAKVINRNARIKGWYDKPKSEDDFIESMCNNLHDEISELHEAWRNNTLHAPCDKANGMSELGLVPLTCLEEELADVVIRALDNAKHLKVDIEHAVKTKHAYNKSREHRHGGKKS